MQRAKDLIQLSWQGAISTVAGAFIAGAVSMAFGWARIANSIPFAVSDNTKRIEAVEAEKLDRDIFEENQKAILREFDNLNKKTDFTDQKIDKIMDRLNIVSVTTTSSLSQK